MVHLSATAEASPLLVVEVLHGTAKLGSMGRFASTVEFYARYREPYPPKFFKRVAE
jgi:hypothetical protein